MKLSQLKLFAALAEELHFGKAAARLNVSQPPFSRQIQALEHELGVALVVRRNQRVTLTPAGAAFRADIAKVFAALEFSAKHAKAVAAGEAAKALAGQTSATASTNFRSFRMRRLYPRRGCPDVNARINSVLTGIGAERPA